MASMYKSYRSAGSSPLPNLFSEVFSAPGGRGVKCFVVAPTNSMHSFRWCKQLELAGYRPILVSSVNSSRGDEQDRTHYIWPFIPTTRARGIDLFIRKKLNILSLMGLLALLLTRKKAPVNIHYLTGVTLRLAYYLSVLAPDRLIVSCWGTDVNKYFSSAKGKARRRYLSVYSNASLVTCDSEAIRDTILADAPGSNVRIIPWGVDEKVFMIPDRSARMRARSKYSIPEGNVVFLSNRLPTKNYQLEKIVEWFTDDIASKGKATLLMHAAKKFSDGTFERISRATEGVSSIIVSGDMLPYSELPELYAAADFFLSFPEMDAMPVSMIEAMASGNIVLASNEIPAYQHLAKRYELTLLPLKAIEGEVVSQLIDKKEAIAGGNRSRFLAEDSLTARAKSLAEAMACRSGS